VSFRKRIAEKKATLLNVAKERIDYIASLNGTTPAMDAMRIKLIVNIDINTMEVELLREQYMQVLKYNI
jgi:hypothetical protein